MRHSEALELVAFLEAAFVREVGDSSRVLFASELTEYEYEDGLAGVRWLIRSESYFPVLGRVHEAVQDAARIRQDKIPALPAPLAVPEDFTPDKSFWRRVRTELEARGLYRRTRNSIGNAIPEPRLNEADVLAASPAPEEP